MSEKYIKSVLQQLCEAYKYNVIEIPHSEGLISQWAAININDSEARVVVFADINKSEIDYNKIENQIRSTSNYKNISIVPIFIIDNNIENNKQLEELNYGFIIMDIINNRVIYNDEKNKQLASELQSILIRKNSQWKNKVTYILIGINIVMYLITLILAQYILSKYGNDFANNKNIISYNYALLLLGAKVNSLIAQGQYYRLFTCMFLHGGLLHLTLNMYSLYNIGPLIETIYGKTKYLIVYFISGITASIFSYLFSEGMSEGASGAIFGIVGITLVFAFSERKKVGNDFYKSLLKSIVVNVIIGLSIPNIDNYAHLGGFLGGVIVGAVYMIINKQKQRLRRE